MTLANILKKFSLVAAGTVALTVGAVEAAEAIVINLGGSDLTATSISDTVGDISYTATGFSTNSFSPTRNVIRSDDGLGVQSIFNDGENPEIDGRGFNETLRLTFDQEVTLNLALFDDIGRNDGFKLLIDGVELISQNVLSSNPFDFTTDFSKAARTGTIFDFTVAQNNDDYFLAEIDVEPVPEPLTILGSLSALGVGTVLKKKQKKA